MKPKNFPRFWHSFSAKRRSAGCQPAFAPIAFEQSSRLAACATTLARFLAGVVCLVTLTAFALASAQSQWVRVAPDGALAYKTTPRGDRIMDFSSAGYMGGGTAFPDAPVKQIVRPLGNGADDTANIQAAIDAVGMLPMENGVRGAVLLASGTFCCADEVRISKSGIVLRGSGSGGSGRSSGSSRRDGRDKRDTRDGRDGTVIWMSGRKHAAININVPGSARGNRDPDVNKESGGSILLPSTGAGSSRHFEGVARDAPARTFITDDYVPSGANAFRVASVGGFVVGDIIEIRRPTTKDWVRFMGMDAMTRNGGRPQTWLGLTRSGFHIRRIAAIDNTTRAFTLDAPLSDSFDARYLGNGAVTVTRIAAAEPVLPLSQVGVEHLRIQCPPLETAYGNAPFSGIRVGGQDCWVDDVWCVETMNTIPITGRRVTIRDTHVTHTYPNLGASKPADFSIENSQILIDRCSSDGENTYWVWTNSYNTGPNVVLNSDFTGRGSRLQPHQRWATGLLVDNCRAPDGGIDFSNRGVAGSGHGWTMGWGVAWNSTAKTFIIQNPPGALNWAIGCIGERLQTARYFETAPILAEGEFDSHGTPVAPRSLYLAQLAARLGSDALAAIGYAPESPAARALENPAMPKMRPRRDAPIDSEFGENLAFLRPVNTSSNAQSDTADPRKYGGEKAVDGNPATYWMAGDGRGGNGGRGGGGRDNSERDRRPNNPTLEIDTEGPLVIDALTLSEPAAHANIRAYKIEGQVDSDYKLLAEGTTIGGRKTHTFPKVTVWKVRLTILKTEGGAPAVSELTLHLTAEPMPSRAAGIGSAGFPRRIESKADLEVRDTLRAAWMQVARFGVMSHFLADWRAKVDGEPMSIAHWNELVDGFNVEKLAGQLVSVGAKYFLITIGQNSGYFLAPNATYDRLTGVTSPESSKCSRRDLVSDLSAALAKRGIKLMVYLPSGAPVADRAAVKALEFQNGPFRNREFQVKWEAVIRDWSLRWGDKICGWWFDGCYWPNAMYRADDGGPGFATFAAAARAGNPNSAVGFNPGVFYRTTSMTPHDDYTAGEVNKTELWTPRHVEDGKVDGAQVHVLSFLGETWGMGKPRYTDARVVEFSREVAAQKGAITWDAPIQKDGTLAPEFLGSSHIFVGETVAGKADVRGTGVLGTPKKAMKHW